MTEIASGRFEYTDATLERDDLDPNPIAQFQGWLADAGAAGTREPQAMTLATAGADGAPSARVVLLRSLDERGFTWYTNRESLKGRDLRPIHAPHWSSGRAGAAACTTVSAISAMETPGASTDWRPSASAAAVGSHDRPTGRGGPPRLDCRLQAPEQEGGG